MLKFWRAIIAFTGRFGLHELGTLVALLIIVAGIWGFVWLADEVREKSTQTVDERVLIALRKKGNLNEPIGPKWLADVGRDITAMGGVAILTMMTLAVCGFLWFRGQHAAMFFVLVAALGGLLISSGLKGLIDRPRPTVVPHLAYVSSSSFPSGHSMMSAVVYLTLGSLLARFVKERGVKIYVLAVGIILTGLVGVSRMYMGVHYPTDVLAGWTAGIVWALICWLLARQLQRRGKVEREVKAGEGGGERMEDGG
jgi:undecaprenyl-diphosphatase